MAEGTSADRPVRYHVPRRRSPLPAVVVGALLLGVLVAAQAVLALAGPRPPDVPASSAAGTAATSAPQGTSETTARRPTAASGNSEPLVVEVGFAVGSVQPRSGSQQALRPVVDRLQADPDARVRVVGHAEASNDPVLEEQISRRRADAVADLLADLLAARGAPAAQVELVAAGAEQASDAGPDRRVTVEVTDG